ncbi:hemopexin repeat-containing protein [Actinoplanes lobatus]|uniref:Hemopexin n=1 Tax=Actinoplanes lobatus TaxID=113568 RepID=A0A7W7HJT6_9ACTN|nr:hemopexin repeat-containing protein [Actinoplanes lobatus]MBB4751809.1 hypothetical protein [Actinoplanes lobatus]
MNSESSSRSVYSPAAYLAELLKLAGPGPELTGRRPDLAGLPSFEDGYAEVPHLDIVNEILAREIERGGAELPSSVRHERIRAYLRHLGVEPAELYRLYAAPADPDVVARESLGLTADDVATATTPLDLARRLELSSTDVDLALRTLCDGVLDRRAIRVLAVVERLHRTLALSFDVVVGLVGPVDVLPALVPADAGRLRVAAALHTDEKSLTTIVRRYRGRIPGTGPFDPGADPNRMLRLLHRITRLAAALSLSVGELLDIVEAVRLDPALALPILIDTEVTGGDPYQILDQGDPDSALWLVQTLVALAGWLRSAKLTGTVLRDIIGGARPAGLAALRARLDGSTPDVLAILREEFGTPAIEAICVAVAGSLTGAVRVLTGPAGAAELAARRIRGFARFATLLGLSPAEVTAAFRDRDLAAKFGEPLELPPGVDRIDALLERADGTVHLFHGRAFWTYAAGSRELTAGPAAIDALSVRFARLAAVDAAFVDAAGTEWIVGRDTDGRSQSFTRQGGQPEFLPRPQTWGVVRNSFADPAHIDAAFTDEQGHTYLFAGDQYVRYSTADHTTVDEGYPRLIADDWAGLERVDQAFVLDGQTYLLSGDRVLSPGTGEHPLAETWPQVTNALAGTGRVDAGYADGPAMLFFAGNQVFRHSDSIENDGVRVDEGFPRRIASVFADLPAAFADGVQAAFRDANGTVHLFQDGSTVALGPDGASVAPTAERWGRLAPALPSGTVDAVLAGRDGHTYLFSGTHYLRYTGADYTTVDEGYPRLIADDWSGLERVDHAFVLDGQTHLFGGGRMLRYSAADYTIPDAGYPQPAPENWWRLPERLFASLGRVDTVFITRDGRIHLFSGGEFVTSDARRRRWSPPQTLKEQWDSLPFDRVDAAFTGADDRTYVFSGTHYARYSDPAVTRIDDQYPAMIDQFWGRLVSPIARTGRVDAALVAGEHTYLFSGDRYVRWTGTDPGYPRRLAQLSSEPAFAGLTVTLTSVDAAVADRGTVYLISGRQIHAVSTATHRRYPDLALDDVRTAYLDSGGVRIEHPDGWRHYSALEGRTVTTQPDRPRALRTVPAQFRSGLDAVLTTVDGNVFLFKGETCFDTRLGRRLPHPHVDAAVSAGGHTYLFSGDQYVRAAATDPRLADPGYPRRIVGNLLAEPGFAGLPAAFEEEIDARYADGSPSMIDAVLAGERTMYLFAGRTCHAVSTAATATYELDRLGRIRNTIAERGRVDAALVDGEHTYLFSGDQFVRYTGGDYRRVDDGYPRPLADFTLAELPPDGVDAVLRAPDGELYVFAGREYRRGNGPSTPIAGAWGRVANEFDGDRPLDAAFVTADGELYAFRGSQFVRYALGSTLDTVDPGHPLRISGRWGQLPARFQAGVDGAFRLHDQIYLHLGDEVVRLGDDHGEPVTFRDLLPPSADYRIGDLRAIQLARGEPGRDEDELNWCRGFGADPADAFALADRFGVGPSTVHADVWTRLYGPEPDLDAAAAALQTLIAAEAGAVLHGEINVRTRDALVAALLAGLGLRHPRELSDRFLTDVEAGAQAMTSRIGEAIAAVRLYLQRRRARVPGYQEWAAERKRLLYPENHLRPGRTPPFETLEQDLLDGDLGDAAIERAYRRYLDEYTEVSRLIVAGGFADAPNGLVLFGRSRIEPRRYHHRQAELNGPDARWTPWQPVGVPIDADRVHPVRAFGRIFVFWVAPEPRRLRIRYSYQRLDHDWVPAQTLGAGEEGAFKAANLLVRVRTDSILVSCSYTVSADGQTDRRAAAVFTLHPELYVDDTPPDTALALATDLETRTEAAATTDRVAQNFADPVADVVRFDLPAGAESWPWFSVDIRGASHLCRPVTVPETEKPPLRPLRGNPDRLPAWDRIDAGFELPNGDRYCFDNGRGVFTVIPARGGRTPAAQPISARFGRLPQALPVPGPVDAVLTRASGHTYVFIGDTCLRYTGPAFGRVDPGFPQRIEQAAAAEGFPAWPRIDLAFTDVQGNEWFYQESAGVVINSAEPGLKIPIAEFQQGLNLGPDFGRIVTVLVTGPITYVIGETRYARYSFRPGLDWWGEPDRGYPRALRGNVDGLPGDRIISEAFEEQGNTHYIDNHSGTVLSVAPDGGRTTRPLHATSEMTETSRVDAAWLADSRLYLTCGREYHRYTLGADQTIPDFPDPGYPQRMPRDVSAAFRRGEHLYLFTGDHYCRVPAGQEPHTLPTARPVAGAWSSGTSFDGVLDGADALFLFVPGGYHRHAKNVDTPHPYELAALPFELIPLTGGAATELNRKLLTDGLPALLSRTTQQPTVFRGADGQYHWEIFGHGPLLVARKLRAAQRFADARRWYEHILDPADTGAVWQLLPLLDPDAPFTAYRNAVVLDYLGNLLEWADQLFQQNTRDALAEARLLCLLAEDLLPQEHDLTDGIFTIPENEVLTEYRSRIADRLRRQT